jgi:hypothetical protein
MSDHVAVRVRRTILCSCGEEVRQDAWDAHLYRPAAAVPEAQDGREVRYCARCAMSYRWWTETQTFSHLIGPSDGHMPVLHAADAKFWLLASAAVREGERERLAEAWERGVAAEREFASRVQAYHHWSSISAGPPEPPTNPYLAALSLPAPEGTDQEAAPAQG